MTVCFESPHRLLHLVYELLRQVELIHELSYFLSFASYCDRTYGII